MVSKDGKINWIGIAVFGGIVSILLIFAYSSKFLN
jgi:hypothetical protein